MGVKPEKRTSKFRGVGYNKQHRRWVSWFLQSGRKTHLGMFDSEESAARAYDERAKKVLGSKAILNFQ